VTEPANEHPERLGRLVHALAFLDESGGEVLDAHPDRAQAGAADGRHVLAHLQRVVHRRLGRPTNAPPERFAARDLRAHQLLQDGQRPRVIVEEVVVGAEVEPKAVLFEERRHLLPDALRALAAVLALVVRRDRAVGTAELAAEREHERRDRAVLAHAVCRQRSGAECARSARPLEQAVSDRRVGQLVEVAEQALHSGIDDLAGYAVAVGARVAQAGDAVEQPAVAHAQERVAHRLALRALGEQQLEQAQPDELLARDDNVGALRRVDLGAKRVPRRVDRLGSTGDDERPMSRIDASCVRDQLGARRGVQEHARDQKQVRDAPIQPHLRRTEVSVPLLQDDPRLLEAGIRHGRAHGTHACRSHAQVRSDEGKEPRPVVEGTGDHGHEVVVPRQFAQTASKVAELPRPKKLVAPGSSREFHGTTVAGEATVVGKREAKDRGTDAGPGGGEGALGAGVRDPGSGPEMVRVRVRALAP